MQIDSGLRSLLARPWVYRLSMRLLGNTRNQRWFVDKILALHPGQKIVDIGCGTADVLQRLPSVSYVGLDVSDAYVQTARRDYGDRGVFLSGGIDEWLGDLRTRDADLVLANGVLHHVDDNEAGKMLRFAKKVIKPNGRFVFYEPCYLLWQSRFSSFMMSKDRGQNIRTEQEWTRLAESVFPHVATNILTDVNNLGYTCIIGQCSNRERGALRSGAGE